MDETSLSSAARDIASCARGRAVLGHHVMLRLEDDRTIALSAADRRVVARLLYEHGEPRGLLAFRIVGSHIHALLACDRPQAGLFARLAATAAPRTIDTVVKLLPRVRPRALLGELGGTPALENAPAAIDHLAAAAAAAFGLADLDERAWETALARRAAAHAARALAPPSVLAKHLGVSTRAVQRHQATPIDPAYVRAVDLRLRLRARPRTSE